jgi:hypothetical protein
MCSTNGPGLRGISGEPKTFASLHTALARDKVTMPLPARKSLQSAQQTSKNLRVEWFDEMVIEASLGGTATILLLPPTR